MQIAQRRVMYLGCRFIRRKTSSIRRRLCNEQRRILGIHNVSASASVKWPLPFGLTRPHDLSIVLYLAFVPSLSLSVFLSPSDLLCGSPPATLPLSARGSFICRNIHRIKVIALERARARGCVGARAFYARRARKSVRAIGNKKRSVTHTCVLLYNLSNFISCIARSATHKELQ